MEERVRSSAYTMTESFTNSDLPKIKKYKINNSIFGIRGFIEKSYYSEKELSTEKNLYQSVESVFLGQNIKYVTLEGNSLRLRIQEAVDQPYFDGQTITLSTNKIEIISNPLIIEYRKVNEKQWVRSVQKIERDKCPETNFFGWESYPISFKTISKGVLIEPEPEEIKKYLELMEKIKQGIK